MPFLVFSQGYGKFPWLYKYDVKTVVEKLGGFSDHISQKHHAFIMISVDIKKTNHVICMTGLTKKYNLINAVYFCNLVNVFWNNNKRNMERKKLANMNREKAYTKYIYMWHTKHRCNIYVYSHTTSVFAQMTTLPFEFIP